MYIGLLRAVNVGGRNLISMAELRGFFGGLGFPEARTLLQSGNIVFSCTGQTAASLEKLLERETREKLKVPVDYFVRTTHQWHTTVDRNPFPRQAKSDPGRLIVFFLKKSAAAADIAKLRASIRGPETITADGSTVYAIYPQGMGRSKLTSALIERTLGSKGTARNWNTVMKLLTVASSAATANA